MAVTNRTIQQCKEVLVRQYGKRLKGVILYGSMARGQATSDSDIDLLVLLEPPWIISLNCVGLWMCYIQYN